MRKSFLMMILVVSQSLWANSLSYSGFQVGTMMAGVGTAVVDAVGCAYSVKARLGIANITDHVERSLWGSSVTSGTSAVLMTIAASSAFGPAKFTQAGEVLSGAALLLNSVNFFKSAVAHGVQDHQGDVSVELKVSAAMGYIAPAINLIHFLLGIYVTARKIDDANTATAHEPAV